MIVNDQLEQQEAIDTINEEESTTLWMNISIHTEYNMNYMIHKTSDIQMIQY